MVKVLLSYGANPNLKNKYGETALSLAKEKNYRDIIDLLIQAGATQ
jgi:ankyrin repeat protein